MPPWSSNTRAVPAGWRLWLFLVLAASAAWSAPVPSAEKLLPDDTLLVVTAPDFTKLRSALDQSSAMRFWRDPAMKPFRDKLASAWEEEFVKPLERELNLEFKSYTSLPEGQLTFALTRNGWQGEAGQQLGYVFLLDTGARSGQLKTNLAALGKRWADAGKRVRSQKVREFDFMVVPMSSNDIPRTLQRILPRKLPYHELGEPEPKPEPESELLVGQAGSLLMAANSAAVLEKLVIRLTGGAVPALGDLDAYAASHRQMFRDAPLYGWINLKAFVEVWMRQAAEKKENPQAPNPMEEVFKADKLLEAAGFSGLKTAAFSYTPSAEGGLWQVFVAAPESSRAGLFKLLAGEPKESAPPPFAPADVVKFQRWRIDGQKAWATLEKLLASLSPHSLTALNFIFDTANQAASEKAPGFDVRKGLIANLGDDMIYYEKAPLAGTASESGSTPSLFLLGSPNAEQLAASLKYILIFMTAQAGAPAEREFLGRKVFSVPLPAMPITIPGAGFSKPPPPRTLHYSASGGYVAFSTDVAMLEEFLRSNESQAKALRDTVGFPEAAQRVTGAGSAFFWYENRADSMRELFERLKNDPGAATNISSLKLVGSVAGMAKPERSVRDWMDFSLLPPFDKVSKYFNITVYGGGANVDGLSYKVFSPVSPALKNAP